MAWRDMFDKLNDIIYAPVKLVTDWAGEPLRRREDQRKENSADNQLRRDIERKSAEERISSERADNQLKREIERKTAERRVESELRMKEKEKENELFAEIEQKKADIKRIESEILMKEKEKDTELDIRKTAETQRIIAETEAMKAEIKKIESEIRMKEKEKENELLAEIEQKKAEVKRIESEILMKEKEKETELDIRKASETQRLVAETEAMKAEIKKIESEIRMKEKEKDTELDIRKATEVNRILTEIEELRKDQHFQRMKAVSEAIMKFQTELTRLNVEAVNSIGNMQLELREKAQNLVYSKTIKYKELQDVAMEDALKSFEQVETKFANNEVAKKVLNAAIEKRLANIIDTAHNFLLELNNDIKILNERITLLAESGQKFIENHLGHFHSIGFENQNVKSIENKPQGS